MRQFFSIFFLIVFLVLFPFVLLSLNLKTAVLNPTFFKETFRQISFYERVVKIDPQKVANYVGQKSGGQMAIPAEKIGNILGYITPEDLQYTFEKNIDASLASLKKGGTDFSVDLTAIKKSLAKNSDPQVKSFLQDIPDTYAPPQTNKSANKYLSLFPVRKIMSYMWPVIAFLSLVFSVMFWPSWRGRARLVGIVFLCLGLLVLVGWFVGQRIPIPYGIIADFLDDILRDIMLAAKAKILSVYFKESLVMIIVGLALFVASFFIKNNQDSQPPPSLKSA